MRDRVRVACQSCATFKVKCNDERPCSRCTRLGLTDCADPETPRSTARRLREPRSRNACAPCAKSKVRCEDEKPCARCVRLGREDQCVVKPPSPQPPEPEPERCLSILSPIGTIVDVPPELTHAFRYGHRRYIRSNHLLHVPLATINGYLRTIRCVLSQEDVDAVQQEITKELKHARCLPPPVLKEPPLSNVAATVLKKHIRKIVFDTDLEPAMRYTIKSELEENASIVEFNRPARMLFGYTNEELTYRSTYLQESILGMVLPNFWKFLHPTSWHIVAENYIKAWFEGLTTLYFPVLKVVCKNGKVITAKSIWQISAVFGGATVRPTTMPTNLTRVTLTCTFEPFDESVLFRQTGPLLIT